MTTNMAVQAWNPTTYARDAGFVPRFGEALVDVLAPQAHERILDVGCGDGVLSEKIAASGCTLTGIDASAEQVAAARARGLDAHVMNGAQLTFDNEFNAVFSNATLHWLKNPSAVLQGVQRALRPRGRFVAEFGGADNVKVVCDALLSALARRGVNGAAHFPWYFPTPDEYRAQLEAAGFVVDHISHFARPTPQPGSVTAWIALFGDSFTHALAETERADYLSEVERELAPKLRNAEGVWVLDYVRLRVVAHRE